MTPLFSDSELNELCLKVWNGQPWSAKESWTFLAERRRLLAALRQLEEFLARLTADDRLVWTGDLRVPLELVRRALGLTGQDG